MITCFKLQRLKVMKLVKILTACLVIAIAIAAKFPEKRKFNPVVIGYVTGYNGLVDPNKISAEKLTHINYAFVNIKNNQAFLDNAKRDSINFVRLNSLREKNPSLQLLISIGGWSWSENFSNAVLTDSLRKVFAKSAVAIIRKHQLDGVDIDWEYPGMPGEQGNVYRPQDKENYTLMFAELRKELDQLEKETGHKKLLTTATGGFPYFLQNTNMAEAAKFLDYINLMTYDYYSDKKAKHHTNLYHSNAYSPDNSADNAVKAYLNAGVPAAKLVVGIAFYGRNFKLKANSLKGLGDTIASSANSYGKGYTFLKDSLVNKNGFAAYRDEEAKAPFLFNITSKEFISYDDEWSVAHKCQYVLQNQLAGVMFWEYGADEKEYLLNQIVKSFK
jgi:chitinase